MGTRYDSLEAPLIRFIEAQPVFFAECRMTTQQDEPQLGVRDARGEDIVGTGFAASIRGLVVLGFAALAPESIDGAVAGHGLQPGLRVVGNPLERPVGQGGDQGLLGHVLGQLQVVAAQAGDQVGDQLAVTAPHQVVDAPVDRIAAVMSFSQEMTARGEADMTRMTQNLIDRMLEIGGAYYLPYRPHARQDQFERCYPRAAEFASAKRQLDPMGLLRNNLWDSYLVAA